MDNILFNFTIPKIVNIVMRKLFIIILIAAIGAAALGFYGYRSSTTTYMAKVSFYVVSNPSYLSESSVNVSATEFTMAKNLVPSYMLILKSDTVLNEVIDNLGINYRAETVRNMITSSTVEDTSVFYVYVYCSDPYEAMEIANGIAEVAPDEIARVVKSGGIEVIDYAVLPTVPYSTTNLLKYILIGGAGGFAGSMLIFIFFGLLDTSIRKKSDLEKIFTIPVVGEVPVMLPPSKNKKANKILSESSPFAVKETYNTIRTALLFLAKGESCPCFAFTSANQGDGKTLNCINVAISLAQLGKKVLLIDADLRNPSVLKELKIEEQKEGLSQYLAGISKTLNKKSIGIENLEIVPVGAIAPNPGELIAMDKFAQMIEELKPQYDYILIDTSPIGIVADALALSDVVTGYLLVVKAGESRMTDEKAIVRMLEQVNADISGFIYNAVNPKSREYKRRKYEYNYYGKTADGE